MAPNLVTNGQPKESEKGITFSSTTKIGSVLGRSLTKSSKLNDAPDEDLSALLRKTMRMSTLLDTTVKPERAISYHEYNDEIRRENLYKQAIGNEEFFSLDNSIRTSKLISDFTLAKISEKPVTPRVDSQLEQGNVSVEVKEVKWYKSKRFFYGIFATIIVLLVIILVAILVVS
ncbi:hypothetical protein K493DRAFT_370440 [Basidiobolus meristosporus CBS 931.73]|uniref:Uncharacterized protein n=1 Tax=Basidiobolus meristosporus CBS 931.73 TaxID=1314790 RepID=A0A1Y1YFX0_9FUNG|nr:hypothetical protein K493DRAFT_370440 [Basidiobolus meristosporus CBS 931.73]|eukprot:ORX96885.1 hypothetical protein K493DRAFT_370440 [Basidiobolus meristosporus CBS 931.73]